MGGANLVGDNGRKEEKKKKSVRYDTLFLATSITLLVLFFIWPYISIKPNRATEIEKRAEIPKIMSEQEAKLYVEQLSDEIEEKIKDVSFIINISDSILSQKIPETEPAAITQRISNSFTFSGVGHRQKLTRFSKTFATDSGLVIVLDSLKARINQIDKQLNYSTRIALQENSIRAIQLAVEIDTVKYLWAVVVKEIISTTDKSSYEVQNNRTYEPAILVTRRGRFTRQQDFELPVNFKNEIPMKLNNGFTSNVRVYEEYELDEKKAELKKALIRLREANSELQNIKRTLLQINQQIGVMNSLYAKVVSIHVSGSN